MDVLGSVARIHDLAMAYRQSRILFVALEAGGLLIVNDFLVEDDRSGPPDALLFALQTSLSTCQSV